MSESTNPSGSEEAARQEELVKKNQLNVDTNQAVTSESTYPYQEKREQDDSEQHIIDNTNSKGDDSVAREQQTWIDARKDK